MKRRLPTDIPGSGTGPMTVCELAKDRHITRRQLIGKAGIVVASAALTSGTVGLLTPFGAAFAATSAQSQGKKTPMSPEIKLVDDYNTWFLGGAYAGDMEKLKAGLRNYITNETVLHEPASLPWGGTIVGYEGWVRLCQITDPIFEKLSSSLEISAPQYYQHRNVVLHEVTMTIKSIPVAPEPLVMGILEKYTVENGRIKQIDEFYADTASFLARLSALGVLPERRK
jgi:hypothetical protein